MADTSSGTSLTVPNVVTMLRLACAPLSVWLILEGKLDLAFWVFVFAGVSDGVDGFIAKRFGQQSLLGSYIDPLADKALLVCVYIALGMRGDLPDWLVITVVFRDAVIVGGLVLEHMLRDQVIMRPLMISKLNTLMQIVLASLVLASAGLGVTWTEIITMLTYGVAATTVASGAAYVWNGLRNADGGAPG